MKKIVLVLGIATAFIACKNSGSAGGQNTEPLDVPVEKFALEEDPVCNMSVHKYPMFDSLTYKGNLYGFCSSHCKGSFEEDPEKYL